MHTTDPVQQSDYTRGYCQEFNGSKTRVLPIKVDKQGRERIGLVKKSAYTTYLLFHREPKFIESLPDFQLPMLGIGSFRAFEITDYSMSPIEPGTIVVGEYCYDWAKLNSEKTYIIVHKKLGVLYRRLYTNSHISELKLVAEKQDFPKLYVNLNKVYEIWQARMFIKQ